jgi:hypothetical protein
MPLFRSINFFHVHSTGNTFLRGIINLVLRAFLGYPWLPQISSKNATVRHTFTHILPRTRVVRLNVARARTFLCFRARRENIENQRSERRIPETMVGMTSRDALLLLL